MIYDVYRIGKAVRSDADHNSDALYITDGMSDIKYVISIDFSWEPDRAEYRGIDIVEFNKNLDSDKYLLRKAGSNGPNFGPTAKVSDFQKTVEKKLKAWFKDNAKKGDEPAHRFFGQINQAFEEKLALIYSDLEAKTPADKKAKLLLTVKINDQYPMENAYIFECYKKMVEDKVVGDDPGMIGTCCLCRRESVKMVSAVNVFKFYTKDKPGFISGGFDEALFWRNCPVCTECEPILREGKQYMQEHLRFKFSGLDYYLLPSTIQIHTTKELTELLEDIQHKKFSFEATAQRELTNVQSDFFDYLKDESDINSFRIIFLKQDKAAERILLDIKDIFPSRFNELYLAKHTVNNVFGNVNSQPFGFYHFWYFLSKSEKNMRINDLFSLYLEVIQAIFIREKIQLEALMPHFMREIRYAFNNKVNFEHTVIKAAMAIRYLQEVGCIKKREAAQMSENRNTKIKEFLDRYQAGCDTELKQALVLTGCLIQKVLNIQAFDLNGATPFESQLKGFKMRQDDVFRVLTEAREKMKEYKSYSMASQAVVEEIGRLLFCSPANWPITSEKINFYISYGMPLMNELYQSLDEREDKK